MAEESTIASNIKLATTNYLARKHKTSKLACKTMNLNEEQKCNQSNQKTGNQHAKEESHPQQNSITNTKDALYWKAKYLQADEAASAWKSKYMAATHSVMEIFQEVEGSSYYHQHDSGYKLWMRLSATVQQDRNVALSALITGFCRPEYLPLPFKTDKVFLLQALTRCECRKDNFGDNLAVQLSVMMFAIPECREDAQVWTRILSSPWWSGGTTQEWPFHEAPESLFSDTIALTQILANRPELLPQIPATLLMNKEFLQQVIDKEASLLMHLPQHPQYAFPELILDNLTCFFQGERYEKEAKMLMEQCIPEIKSNPSFAKAWFAAGGPFLVDSFPTSFKDDRDFFWCIAENPANNPRFAPYSFQHASPRLKDDRDLILRAVQTNPYVLFKASTRLQRDVDVVILAIGCCGSDSFFPQEYMHKHTEDRRWLNQLYSHCVSILRQREIFVTTILPCLSLVRPANNTSNTNNNTHQGGGCPLTILNQGPETSQVYKRQLAEYLDVPIGKRLKYFRQASNVLKTGGFLKYPGYYN